MASAEIVAERRAGEIGPRGDHILAKRTALLTNCIPPYLLPTIQRLAASVECLRVFLSTPMETNRPWEPAWDGVDVKVQKTITTTHRRAYKQGFTMEFYRHFPYDTLPLLLKYRPDVIVSAQLGFRTMQSIAYRFLHPASRLVIWADLSEHTESEIGALRTITRRFLLSFADAVLVIGNSGSKYIERLGVPAKRIVTSPYAIDMSALMSIPLEKEPQVARRILYVGQLIERKGVEICLNALNRWARTHSSQSCEIWFVGDGPLRMDLEQIDVPANIRVTFFGNVPYDALPRYYSQCGILVLPCLADTWGLVVNEAMAAGLPVLGSHYSQAVQDLVQDGATGWIFCPDHPDELRNALDRALLTPVSVLASMREECRRRVATATPEYFAGQFLKAIRLALNLPN